MTVVLLHPFPFDARLWHEVSQLLRRDDVVIPNLLGCGGRATPDAPPSMTSLAADVWQQVGSTADVTVIGISLGGYVAMEMLRQRPVAALGLVDTKVTADTADGVLARERLAESMEQHGALGIYAQQAIPSLLGTTTVDNRPHVVQQVRDWITQAHPSTVAWLARAMAARPDSTADLETFTGPVLLLRGDEDTISSAGDFDHMESVAPHAHRVTLKGCGHLPPVEDPQATAAAMREWLANYK